VFVLFGLSPKFHDYVSHINTQKLSILLQRTKNLRFFPLYPIVELGVLDYYEKDEKKFQKHFPCRLILILFKVKILFSVDSKEEYLF